jgi:hypothetical protein
MNWQIESITLLASLVGSCGLVMVSSKMHSVLTSRIYTNGAQPSASGAVCPDVPSSIPNLGAEFPHFTLKTVEHSRYLPLLTFRLISSQVACMLGSHNFHKI